MAEQTRVAHPPMIRAAKSASLVRSSLRRNSVWSVLGNVGYLATQWGFLSLIAKRDGPDSVGLYTFALAVTAPLMMFAGMRLRLLQSTDAARRFSFSDYLGFQLSALSIAVPVLGLLCLIGPFDGQSKAFIAVIGLTKAIDLLSETCFGLWQLRERMELVLAARMLNGLVSLAGFAVVLLLTDSVVGGLLLSAAVSVTVLLTFNIYWVWRLNRGVPSGQISRWPSSFLAMLPAVRPTWSLARQRELLALGLPLAVATCLLSLDTSLPRFVIQYELDETALGIFSALAYVMLVGATLVDALGYATSPRLAQYYLAGEHDAFRSLLLKLLGLGVSGTAAIAFTLYLFGEEVLAIVYTDAFTGEISLLLLLTLATGIQFVGTILGFGMTVVRNLRAQVLLQTVALLAGFMLYVPLTRAYGLNGVGLAAVAIAIFRTVGAVIFTLRYMAAWRPPEPSLERMGDVDVDYE